MTPELPLVPQLPSGWFAYVDVDWLSTGSGDERPAILADTQGALRWRSPDSPPVIPSDADSDLTAGRALAWTADRAVSAVAGLSGTIDVVGSGALAGGIEELLRRRNGASQRSDRPAAIIVTEGRHEALLAATRTVADLGVVVIALETTEPVALDLYPDVHSRGVTLRGVPGPLAGADDSKHHPLETLYAEMLVRIPFGEPVRDGARWFRVSGEPPTE